MGSCGISLVIEDDPDIGSLLETILTGMGFDVRVETTGTAGLLIASGVELALITLDAGASGYGRAGPRAQVARSFGRSDSDDHRVRPTRG